MAWWDGGGLLGGGSDPLDIYGDLFTKEQKAALAQRSASEGLLRMAGAFGKAAQPSRAPTSFWGSLGEAAGALAGSGDQAAESALKAMKVGEDVRESKAKREALAAFYKKLAAARAQESQLGLPQGTLTSQITPPTGLPGQTTSATAADAVIPAPEASGAPPLNAIGMPASPAYNPNFGIPARPGAAAAASPYWPAPTTPDQFGAPPAAQQNAGLLPPQDQMVGPDGQPLTGQGILPTMNASYGGMPGGVPPFRLASSTPTGDATPTRDDPRGVVPYIRERARALGIDPDVAERVARSEGVGSFQSNVIQKGGRREPSYGAFQLYTGGGMGNDFQRDTGLDPADPQNEKATIDYALQKARTGGWTPVHGAKVAGISARAGIPGGEDYVIPSGRGVPRSALRNVADTGAARGGGIIPGLNMTPQDALELNLLAKMGGLGDVVSPFLEQYYKSPGYIAEAERTRAQAGKDVDLKMDPLIVEQRKRAEYKVDMQLKPELDAAVARLQSPILKERAQAQADIDRITKQLEQTGAAALRTNDATVLGPDGVPVTQKLTDLEFARRQQDRANRMAKGDMTPKPGDIVGTPVLSEAEKPTSDIKEYNFYAQQTRERGGIPDPYETWDRNRKKAGATTINTAEGMEAAQTKARIGVDQKIATDVAEQAIAGRRLLPVLDELAYLADKTPEGWRGTVAPAIGRAMAGLGMSVPPEMSNAEAFQALAQRLVPIVREPGATSQGEMSIYLQAGPQLAGTTEGRKKLIAMNKAMVERSQEIARVYRDNIGSPQLYEKLAALDKPLFTEEQRAALNMAAVPKTAGSTATPGGGATAPLPPPIGTVRDGYRFKGGTAGDPNNWERVP
jgi:hypothetical protein